MVTEGGHKASEVARSLGINPTQLYLWKKKFGDHGDKAFPNKGYLTELAAVRRQLREVEMERKEYKSMLEAVVNHLDALKEGMDIAGKKGLMKLIFRRINVKDGKIENFELFEPFKSLYEGVEIKCQIQKTKELLTIRESVSTLEPSVDRWLQWREMILGLLHKLDQA